QGGRKLLSRGMDYRVLVLRMLLRIRSAEL
ncbi:hypothetical protein A2U01_0081136, partial [Trifolium medium]|nr:hypothetical protein [Trifolium medium]